MLFFRTIFELYLGAGGQVSLDLGRCVGFAFPFGRELLEGGGILVLLHAMALEAVILLQGSLASIDIGTGIGAGCPSTWLRCDALAQAIDDVLDD